MTKRKHSNPNKWAKEKADFHASLGPSDNFDDLWSSLEEDGAFASDGRDAIDDAFAQEAARERRTTAAHDKALRSKACESKTRYATSHEAKAMIAHLAAEGTRNLSCYRCEYCDGWHLTSHPRPEGNSRNN